MTEVKRDPLLVISSLKKINALEWNRLSGTVQNDTMHWRLLANSERHVAPPPLPHRPTSPPRPDAANGVESVVENVESIEQQKRSLRLAFAALKAQSTSSLLLTWNEPITKNPQRLLFFNDTRALPWRRNACRDSRPFLARFPRNSLNNFKNLKTLSMIRLRLNYYTLCGS